MAEIERTRDGIAPSVVVLLAAFHVDTPAKQAIAPAEGVVLRHCAHGITEVDEHGWCADYDDTTTQDSITVEPVSVVDTES